MNLNELTIAYPNAKSKTRVDVTCKCNKKRNITFDKALKNIEKNDEYLCRSCSMQKAHLLNPMTEETKEKLRQGRLGKKHSEESKNKMREKANEKWESPEGHKLKKRLSKLTAYFQGSKKLDKSKRKVFYISLKNNNDIKVCGSSYEYIACEDFFEKDDAIESYECQVPYEVEDRSRSLDFLLSYKDGSKKAIEIKPKKRLNEEYNILQFSDSKANAEKNGWSFEIWTEVELNISHPKFATARADEYRKQHYLLDYAAYRKQKDRIKSVGYYHTKIKKDKVVVYCDYCKTYHFPLRLTYDRNISRNNEYVCERKGGFIAGSKPKPSLHKVNPYAEDGKKECNLCKEVLSFESFGKDKDKFDGLSTRCKKCRAKVSLEKYQQKKGR